jgi:hypothetical protein
VPPAACGKLFGHGRNDVRIRDDFRNGERILNMVFDVPLPPVPREPLLQEAFRRRLTWNVVLNVRQLEVFLVGQAFVAQPWVLRTRDAPPLRSCCRNWCLPWSRGGAHDDAAPLARRTAPIGAASPAGDAAPAESARAGGAPDINGTDYIRNAAGPTWPAVEQRAQDISAKLDAGKWSELGLGP